MAIAAVNSNSSSAWQQFQLQQAQRVVDQARQNAQSLQTQASRAQAVADAAQAEATALSGQASQAQSSANRASLQLESTKSLQQVGTQVSGVLDQAVQRQTASPAATNGPTTGAVVNTSGQTTGTVVNTTA